MLKIDYFKNNIYSQFGEDGIIEKVFSILPDKDNWCCEFGAWDGELFSNTCNLIRNNGYSAVLIESDKIRFKDLINNYKDNNKITTINRLVNCGSNTLDSILQHTMIPAHFDVLSIDIDGEDYHIWKSIENYCPKIVIVEYNQTISDNLQYVQTDIKNTGSSLLSFLKLAQNKNYFLIAITASNLIFIDTKYKDLFKEYEQDYTLLRSNDNLVSNIIQAWDGKLYLMGNKKLFWKEIELTKEILIETIEII